MPSTTPPGSSQNPQSFLRHPFPHTFPSSFKAMAFPRTTRKGERRRCPACTSLLANGNLGSGSCLGFPHLGEPSEKLAGVLLPFVQGLGAGDASPDKGKSIPLPCRERLCPAAHRWQGTAGSLHALGSLLLLGDAGGRVPITLPSRSRFMSLPNALPQPSRKAGAGGWRGGLFAGNCESTFLHGCVPLCNGNPLSRVKRRPSYHDLLCRFPWIPCTINKKRNFKPVFNPA